ncbi:MAG: hypothetical protein ABJC04_00965 [Verrucomicrobiota bacterium]
MSAKKIKSIDSSEMASSQFHLSLSAEAYHIRKSGIEFRSSTPIPAWTEVTLDLERADTKKFHCTGVVVECEGSRHTGYLVSLLFTNLPPHSQAVLRSLTFP